MHTVVCVIRAYDRCIIIAVTLTIDIHGLGENWTLSNFLPYSINNYVSAIYGQSTRSTVVSS